MPIYGSEIYADTFFGSDEFGDPPGGPANLNAYQNVIENVILYWTLNPCTPFLSDYTWTIDTDLVDTFASPDLRTYVSTDQEIVFDAALITDNSYSIDVDASTVGPIVFATDSNTTMAAIAAAIEAEAGVGSATVEDAGDGDDDNRRIVIRGADIEVAPALTASAVTLGVTQASTTIAIAQQYIDACVHQGLVVPIYTRQQGETDTMYWRVKGTRAAADTSVTESTFEIPEAIDELTRDSMLEVLPDVVYCKASTGNIYKLDDAVGNEFDLHNIEVIFANNNLSTLAVQDQKLDANFSDMVEIIRPEDMELIDFREIIRGFMIQARNSPTIHSVRTMVRTILCEEPTITPIRDVLDKYVDDPSSTPVVEPVYVEDTGSAPPVEEPILWDHHNLAFGTIVDVTNPLSCSVDREFVENILRKLVPAHAPLYVRGI